jgi:hypothetical protein
MHISEEALEEFQMLYAAEFEVALSNEEAREVAAQIEELVRAVLDLD